MDKNKEELYAMLFEKRIKWIDKNNMKFQISLESSNPRIEAHMKTIYRKYKNKIRSLDEFKVEYLLCAYVSINRFEIVDPDNNLNSWEALLAGESPILMSKVIKNIKVTAEYGVHIYANPDAKFTRGEVDGVKNQHVTYKLETTSLDEILLNSDSYSQSERNDFLSEEDSVFYHTPEEEYHLSFFGEWFEKNKKYILVKSQVEFLENLDKCRKVEGYTENDVQKYTGTPSFKVNQRLKKIKERVLRAWEEEKPKVKNRLERERDKKLKILSEYKAIVEDDTQLENQNSLLTDWIKRNFNKNFVMDMLDDILTKDNIKETNRVLQTGEGLISSEVLYDLFIKVEDAIEKLNDMDCNVKPVFKEKSTRTIERENQRKIQNNSVVYVYKDGVFDNIKLEPEVKKKNNIIYILPGGIQKPTDGTLDS